MCFLYYLFLPSSFPCHDSHSTCNKHFSLAHSLACRWQYMLRIRYRWYVQSTRVMRLQWTSMKRLIMMAMMMMMMVTLSWSTYLYLDVRRLRVSHHICGILIGTLPQVAQQNIFLGLPLQLLPEEVAVLVENRRAI